MEYFIPLGIAFQEEKIVKAEHTHRRAVKDEIQNKVKGYLRISKRNQEFLARRKKEKPDGVRSRPWDMAQKRNERILKESLERKLK